jgi:hypothetical protein
VKDQHPTELVGSFAALLTLCKPGLSRDCHCVTSTRYCELYFFDAEVRAKVLPAQIMHLDTSA